MSEACQRGQHENVAAPRDMNCDGRDGRCPCWCHVVAATDRRLLERCADEATAVARPSSVLDLAAHVRGVGFELTEPLVERVVLRVLDLGWRHVLGHPLPDHARIPDPLLVSASTVRALDSYQEHEADAAADDLLTALNVAEGRRAQRPPTARPVEEVPGV